MSELTHFDKDGRAHMVNVGEKSATKRIAIARGFVSMSAETIATITSKSLSKGDVMQVAELAGIMGAKQTAQLIPLCHPLGLDHVSVKLALDNEKGGIEIIAECHITGKTGVEMEALTAVSITALTIYDMCKAVDKAMVISEVKLVYKAGGKSGTYDVR